MFTGIPSGKLHTPVILPLVLAACTLLACGAPPPAESPDGSEQGPETSDTETTEPDGDAADDSADPGSSGEETGAGSGGETGAGSGGETGAGSGDDFKRLKKSTAKDTHGVAESELKPTKTEALLKFVVVDKGENKPIEGIIVSLTGPDGKKYYTRPTDAVGFADVLVPAGQKYEVVYLSLQGKDIAANLSVENKERFTLKLTLRYKGWVPSVENRGLVLEGIEFDTGKASIRPSSYPRLDSIVEYMTYKKTARIQISGHTDNVGKKSANKLLSTKRAEACRDYLISKGIDGDRIKAVGYGDERPVASNKTPEGRQENRRIEAEEL